MTESAATGHDGGNSTNTGVHTCNSNSEEDSLSCDERTINNKTQSNTAILCSQQRRYEETSTAFNIPSPSSVIFHPLPVSNEPAMDQFQCVMTELASSIQCSCCVGPAPGRCMTKAKCLESRVDGISNPASRVDSTSNPTSRVVNVRHNTIEETCLEIASHALEEKLRMFAETELKKINQQISVLLHGSSTNLTGPGGGHEPGSSEV